MVIFQCLFIAFFMDRHNITVFPLRWEKTRTAHNLKIRANGLRIAGPQIFNIFMLISSWPYALLES